MGLGYMDIGYIKKLIDAGEGINIEFKESKRQWHYSRSR